jgi:hypothetical protein
MTFIVKQIIILYYLDYKFSGKNDFQEFEEILKDHHLTKGEIKALFRLTDLNKDSKVDNEEWFFNI